jgi:hypothetical protein
MSTGFGLPEARDTLPGSDAVTWHPDGQSGMIVVLLLHVADTGTPQHTGGPPAPHHVFEEVLP